MTVCFATAELAVHHGDCLQILPTLPPASVHAVVTDPPYNLSDSGKRDTDCLRRIIAEFSLPDHQQRDAERGKGCHLPAPALSGAPLRGEDGTVRVDARIRVPEGPVDFKGAPVAEQEVNACGEPATLTPDGDLPSIGDAEAVKGNGCYVLKLADGGHAPFCDVTCSCFTEPGDGLIAVTVALPGAAHGDLPSGYFGRARRGNEDIRLGDHAGREPQGATGVPAPGRAEARAVLCLDLRRGTGELRFADWAGERDPLFTLEPAQPVGAGTGAGCQAPVAQSARISIVGGSADRAFTLRLPLNAVNPSARTAGFMGKTWDGFESPAAFQRWCTAWARECLRILKPGGWLLAFGGTRTWHRLACAIEDAGFEIRDSIHWIHGQGFPKSMNVAKAIDKAARGVPPGTTDPTSPNHGRYKTHDTQGHRGPADADRGYGAESGQFMDTPGVIAHADTLSAEAEQWDGWGTALKPGHEPILLARKPLEGTVAANVAAHHTGALHIDACRTGQRERQTYTVKGWKPGAERNRTGGTWKHTGPAAPVFSATLPVGRWPANIVFSHAPGCDGTACQPGCPVAELDAQSGARHSGANPVRRHSDRFRAVYGRFAGDRTCHRVRGAESGGAARFFPVFRYQPKAPAKERPDLPGITPHPTVKPLNLMRWLVRLVAPPGGVVLDPFAGTGTTLQACLLEGFRGIGIERDPGYVELCRARLQAAADLIGTGKATPA